MADFGLYHSYRRLDEKSLRELLRHFSELEALPDATARLDLIRALGDDPTYKSATITKRQRQAIQFLLIRDLPIRDVAAKMKITTRAVQWLVQQGLHNVLNTLKNEVRSTYRWTEEELELLCDPNLSRSEIAERIGRSLFAVNSAMKRYRGRKRIPYAASRSRRAPRSQP